eukprot:scaffold3261_cov349-Prasinococcus_capsulatus_cf.AAC.1
MGPLSCVCRGRCGRICGRERGSARRGHLPLCRGTRTTRWDGREQAPYSVVQVPRASSRSASFDIAGQATHPVDHKSLLPLSAMGSFSKFAMLAALPAVAAVNPIWEGKTCKMCYDTGYEQGQMDCEPDTTGAVTSDPHVSGLQKQSFDFTGEAGKFYALISDENMAVNAKFGTGYTTGLSVDADTLVTSLMRPQGTVRSLLYSSVVSKQSADTKGLWLTETAVILGEHVIEMSIAKSPLESLCPAEDRLKTCFMGGSIKVDHDDVIRTGALPVGDGITVEVTNKNSFGRVTIQAITAWRFEASLDYVPAPAAWKLDEEAAADLAHINFKIKKIALSSEAHGVIGQTSRVKYDENGMPVMAAQDKDGKGVIDGTPEDYELSSLTSTDFKYSVFNSASESADGFTEHQLNAVADKVINV